MHWSKLAKFLKWLTHCNIPHGTIRYVQAGLWKSTMCVQIIPNYIFINIFSWKSSSYLHPVNFIRSSIKFYIGGINLVQMDYKLWQSKVEKVGNFYVPTWFIFAGLVTIIMLNFTRNNSNYWAYLHAFESNA